MASETTTATQILSTLSTLPITHSQSTTTNPANLPPGSAYILPRMPTSYSPTITTTTQTPSQSRKSIPISVKPLRPLPSLGNTLELDVPPETSVYEIKQRIGRRTGYAVGKVKILVEKRVVGDVKTVSEVLTSSAPQPGSGAGSAAAAARLELTAMFTGLPTEAVEQDANAEHVGGGGLNTSDQAAMDAAGKRDVGRAGGVEGSPTTNDAKKQKQDRGTGQRQDVEMGEDEAVPNALGKSGQQVLETGEFWEDLWAFLVQRTRDEVVAGVLVERCKGGWRDWV